MLALEVDVGDLAQQHPGVLLVGEDLAGRRRDLALRQDAGRHLVEQRLEQVVGGLRDHRHVDVGALERLGAEQPAEARSRSRPPGAAGSSVMPCHLFHDRRRRSCVACPDHTGRMYPLSVSNDAAPSMLPRVASARCHPAHTRALGSSARAHEPAATPCAPGSLVVVALGGAAGASCATLARRPSPTARVPVDHVRDQRQRARSCWRCCRPSPSYAATRCCRPLLGTGVLGGFTTLSAYSEETRALLAAADGALAAAYLLGTLAACLVGGGARRPAEHPGRARRVRGRGGRPVTRAVRRPRRGRSARRCVSSPGTCLDGRRALGHVAGQRRSARSLLGRVLRRWPCPTPRWRSLGDGFCGGADDVLRLRRADPRPRAAGSGSLVVLLTLPPALLRLPSASWLTLVPAVGSGVAEVVQPVVVDAEVVGDLVHDGDADLLDDLVLGLAHRQRGVAEDRDPVRAPPSVAAVALGERDAVVEPEQVGVVGRRRRPRPARRSCR